MSGDHRSLYESFALYGSGVTLITTRSGLQDRCFVAASVLTASVDPFTIAVSVGRGRDALSPIVHGLPWALTVLGAQHEPLARRLTSPGMTPEERLEALAGARAERSPEGPLWLPDGLVTVWCSTVATTVVHDQVLVVGEVERAGERSAAAPLLRWNRAFHTAAQLPGAAS